MATAHISARPGDFAPTVLMPGDPLRARWIAQEYLTEPRQVTSVRGMLGFTGSYQAEDGRRTAVSVMASGMGMPSIGIYSYELYKVYGVENIIRVGSAGAYSRDLDLMDLVLADRAWSESTYALAQSLTEGHMQDASPELTEAIASSADRLGQQLARGTIHSSDIFYHQPAADAVLQEKVEELGLLCVEMESFALFHNAHVLGKRAACLLTISDNLQTDRHLDSSSREHSFRDMIRLALETAADLAAESGKRPADGDGKEGKR